MTETRIRRNEYEIIIRDGFFALDEMTRILDHKLLSRIIIASGHIPLLNSTKNVNISHPLRTILASAIALSFHPDIVQIYAPFTMFNVAINVPTEIALYDYTYINIYTFYEHTLTYQKEVISTCLGHLIAQCCM